MNDDWERFWREAVRLQRQQLFLTRLTTAFCWMTLIFVLFLMTCYKGANP